MIKFIATDLDGTLLDEHGALPEEIFPLARRLFERGILFAPASGRQYANLKKLFFPVWEKLLFICENGALVKRGSEIVYLNPIPVSLGHSILWQDVFLLTKMTRNGGSADLYLTQNIKNALAL